MAADIDSLQTRLSDLLRAADSRRVQARPPSGDWSAMENVRHLLFAEQLHFREFCNVQWSPLGWNDRKPAEMAAVGTAQPKKVEDVLDEWRKIHASTRRALKGRSDDEVSEALFRNWRHLRNHTKVVERLLKPSGRG